MELKDKTIFLLNKYTDRLRSIDKDTKPAWGVLSFQGMVEHMSDTIKNHSGKILLPLVTPLDKVAIYKEFAIGDIPFKENTVNKLMGPEAPPLRFDSVTDAINELQSELEYFYKYFENAPEKTTLNPFFGDMNFEDSVHLAYKHAWHHLKQFGVVINGYWLMVSV